MRKETPDSAAAFAGERLSGAWEGYHWWDAGDCGMLSRFPIERLPTERIGPWDVPQVGRITTAQGETVIVVNVRLMLPSLVLNPLSAENRRRLREGHAARLAQYPALAKLIAKARGETPTAQVVLAGDEYLVGPTDWRTKFVLYHPRDVLLTSLVHDHVNVFPTFADYEAPFRELLRLIPADGQLMAREHPAIRAIAAEAACRIVWYDTDPCDGWHAEGVEFGDVSRFTLVGPGGRRVALATTLLGAHNIENIVGVCSYLLERGLVGEVALARAVASFAGIRRRLDRLTRRSTVPVIEGFGSSYEKARSAIEAMLLHYPTRPLTVVFEPHTFSWRSRDALHWYDTVFGGAARVLIVPPPHHGEASHHQSSFAEILERVAATGVAVEGVETAEAATVALSRLAGDVAVLLLSSGPLLGLPDSLPPVFDARYGAQEAAA